MSVGEAPAPGVAATAPESERRLVSVLFADLVGFTAASEDRDPEDVREYLSRYFDVAREIIGRYGGTVEKFIGDAVMAIWGAPIANEDDAERAVRAGLDLVEAGPSLQVGSVGGLQLRVGVLTGEAAVTVGAQGEGMVAGDLVNTASRLQSAAAAGEVLVGEATLLAASDAITFEPAGDQTVKGKALPVAAWRAVRVVAGRKGMGRTTGIEPPFVGRDHELQLLKDLYHATARERRARLVSLVGIAGIGKSRLAWELEKYLDGLAQDVFWHQGRSPSYGDGVTFWALGEMVRRRAGLAEGDDEATTRAKVAATLAEYVADDDERHWIAPRILALLGLEEAPPGQREELFAAWRTFFERVADRGPVMMVFEDLHWADAGLLDFIESILEWSRGRPIFIVSLARPELIDRRPTWGAGQHHFTAIHLEPLADGTMIQLVEGMAAGLDASVVRRIVEQADGVPLYAVETFRMLLDSGRLEVTEGGFRATRKLDRLEIPANLQALIAARLDALPAADRALLQDASILGKTFTLAGLSGISGEAEPALESRLHGLIRRDILELDVDPRSPERGQYGFVQSVIREVAYGTLGRRERRARHLAAARFYEILDDDELAGILASHYVAAYEASPAGPEGEAVAAQARVTLRAAAERALALHSHDQAAALYRQTLTVTTDAAEQAAVTERLADAAYFGGHFEAAKSALAEAIAWYGGAGRTADEVRATTRLGAILLHEGAVPAALSTLEAAAARVEASGGVDDTVFAGLASELARAHWRSAEPPENVLPWAEKALIAAERLGLAPVIAESLNTKAGAMADVGRLQEALALMRGAVRFAEAHGLIEAELRARNNLLFLDLDDPADSLEGARQGLVTARRVGLRDWERQLVAVSLGTATHDLGDWAWCLAQADVFAGDEVPLGYRLGFAETRMAIAAYQGDLEGAFRQRNEIEAQLPAEGDPQSHFYHAFNAGLLRTLSGDPDAGYRTVMAALPTMSGTWAMSGHIVAGTHALLAGDEAALRVVREGWRSVGVRGRVADVSTTAFDAAIDVFEGRVAAGAAGFRSAIEVLDQLGFRVDRALMLTAAVGLLGVDEPYGRVAADQARALIAELGSPTMLALLEGAIERGPRASATSRAAAAPSASRVPSA